MVAVEGPAHVIRYLNPAFARLAEKASDELIGKPFPEALPEPAGNECVAILDRVFATGLPEKLMDQEHRQSPRAYWSYAMWAIMGADERPVGVMIHASATTEDAAFRQHVTAMNEALLIASVQQHELIDTIRRGEQEKRDLQAQLFQTQKLESLGALAGGIAHDLNNMLTPVLGYAQLASDSLPDDSPAAAMLKEVRSNALRAAYLVMQILAFAGKGRFVLEPVNLSNLVREMDGLLESAIAINADLVYDLAPALPLVEADATQLRQVVMNLVTNASESLNESGGTIAVRTGLIPTERDATITRDPTMDLSKGPYVFLEVTDSGCGMTAEVIEKIFDPFFTTKFTGRGLGLAVVLGIARGHNGSLEIRSELGKGSTLRVFLPCSTLLAPVATLVTPPKQEGWRGTGTILVIDDDSAVRHIVSHMLTHVGLSALVAESGLEGLSLFDKNPQKIDVVLLDMTMPGMDGLETARQLKSKRQGLPIVLMSGYSLHEVTLQSKGLGIAGVVQKPFNMKNLLATVRHALGQ